MPWFGETTLPQRHDLPELLDDLNMDRPTMLGNLRDIRRINRLLRWDTMVARDAARLIGAYVPSRQPTILDVGCGTGDLPLAVGTTLHRAGREPHFLCADIHRPILAAARHYIGAALSCAYLCADGLRLPLPDRAIDLVLCSATLHHFPPQAAACLLSELARVTRGVLLVSDLARGWGPYLAARAITAVAMRNRVTRHDGVVSVLRAYTAREVRALASDAGLTGATVRGRLPGRLTLTWVPTFARSAGAAAPELS